MTELSCKELDQLGDESGTIKADEYQRAKDGQPPRPAEMVRRFVQSGALLKGVPVRAHTASLVYAVAVWNKRHRERVRLFRSVGVRGGRYLVRTDLK